VQKFTGVFERQLDVKGRLALPASYRARLGTNCYLTLGEDNGIEVFTEAMFEEERYAVASNRFAAALKPAFDLAGIDFGRADHGRVGGREVVYEINTNPSFPEPAPQPSPIREAAKAIARARLAELFFAIDTPQGPPVAVMATQRVRYERERNGDRRWCVRP